MHCLAMNWRPRQPAQTPESAGYNGTPAKATQTRRLAINWQSYIDQNSELQKEIKKEIRILESKLRRVQISIEYLQQFKSFSSPGALPLSLSYPYMLSCNPQATLEEDHEPFVAERNHFLADNRTNAPSSEAKLEAFQKRQINPKSHLVCGRPVCTEKAVPPHFSMKPCVGSATTCPAASPRFRTYPVSQHFARISPRYTAPRKNDGRRSPESSQHVGQQIYVHPTETYHTDGDIRVRNCSLEHDFLIDLQELKNEIGSGTGESYIKSITCYLEYAREKVIQLGNEEARKWNFPVIIVNNTGGLIGLAAATFVDRPHVEYRGTYSLHIHTTNIEEYYDSARMVCALRIAIGELSSFYTIPNPTALLQPEFPFRNYYTTKDDPTARHYFTYERAVEPKRVFFASGSSRRKLCIKFSRRYCEDAHSFAAKQGFAPNIIAINHFFGWTMIVTENLTGHCVSFESCLQELPTLRNRVREAVIQLHQGGYVHGDIRRANTLVRVLPQGPQVVLLDFDWSGRLGKARYPLTINMQLARPEGVAPNGLITQEHDMQMVEWL
ncbi:hypothetical protein VNI00_002863 [Paramarasmius palmivorus]|uniref:Non-specific serine/threonine protein kinase n=1 Tax=Paramarasmius palmivorus TaxID=297713 RepID=A0AAW0DXA3_9AGAR